MDFLKKERYDINDLIGIVRRLRAPDGCPWDKVQTHESIRKDFIEEVYEAVEAIDDKDSDHLREELGDVLFQVLFHSEIESEKGRFDFSDITDEVSRKMIIRHPHVFGDVEADTTEQVLSNWDAIKMQTHAQKKASEAMDSVSKTLPSLMRAQKLVKKAERGGVQFSENREAAFEWAEERLQILKTECEEHQNCEKALGELLFAVTALAEQLGNDSEQTLYHACDRFIGQYKRYEDITAEKGIDIQDSDTQVTNRYWKDILIKEKLEEIENEQN